MSRYATQGKEAAIVKELKEKGYRLRDLLRAIDLLRSTYYFELSKMDKIKVRNRPITDKITQTFHLHGGEYGMRGVYIELIDQGYVINHKKVQRTMHERKLFGKGFKEKYHSCQGKIGRVADNLINRDFKADRLLQKWATGVPEFEFSWGECYVSLVLDMCTNEVTSYDLSLSPKLRQVSIMLRRAFRKFPKLKSLILRSDQGWQYQHKYCINEFKKHRIKQSMSRKGSCYNSPIMGIFFGRLENKTYYGYEKNYRSFDEFSRAVEECINYYSNERIRLEMKWMPPTKCKLASTTTS